MTYTHKVQYYETDRMGVVHHSNYIRWFEEARTDYLEKLGYGYDQMEQDGIMIPVLSVNASYKAMCRYAEIVSVSAKITDYNGVKMTIAYAVTGEDGSVRCTGETIHGFLTMKEGRPVSLKRNFPEMHQFFWEAVEKENR